MIEKYQRLFVVFKEVEQWQITINIARRERYKFFTTKIYSKERTVIKTTLKTFNLCSSYYGRSRYFFDGHKLPARANGTKREAIWYSELYLSFFDICGTYKARKIDNDKRRRGNVIKNIARICARRTRYVTTGGKSSPRTRAGEKTPPHNFKQQIKRQVSKTCRTET